MPRHAVFLAPDIFSVYAEFVRGLKEVGARVTAIGHTPRERLDGQLRACLDDYEEVPSLLDEAAVVAAVRAVDRRRPVDLVETGDEGMVLLAAKAREALPVPGLSLRSATLCRDKPAMKEALRAAGVPCAASTAVASLPELSSFAELVGYPVILKPRAALGSLGTHRAESWAELEVAAGKLGVDRGESAAVEEFIEGHEGFYDTLAIDGKVEHEFISHYYPNVLLALGDRRIAPQIAATNRVELPSYDELRSLGRKVIEVLGIGTSATHMEWFFGAKGLKFSEIGARPPGERLWDLYCVGNEIDLYREWAMVVAHRQVGARPTRRYATGSIQVRPDRDGFVAGYDGLDAVWSRCRPFLSQYELPRAGTPTVPLYKGYLSNAWFRLRHPDYDELLQLMNFIGDTLRVRAVA